MKGLNAEVRDAVARWRGYREPCKTSHHWGPKDRPLLCIPCSGTGYIQPAEVKALIEALTQRYVVSSAPDYCNTPRESIGVSWGTSCVPRDWEEIGEYALEGVLRHWYWTNLSTLPSIPEFEVAVPLSGPVILAAVGKALEQVYGGKDA